MIEQHLIGTVFEEEELEKKQNFYNLVAKDDKGHKRFHGAFTGGFQAGYKNTVGSAEGWAPSQFTSSRSERAKLKKQSVLDFMDEEDLGKAIAGEHITAKSQFDTLGSEAKDALIKDLGSSWLGDAPQELIVGNQNSFGFQILKNMEKSLKRLDIVKGGLQKPTNVKLIPSNKLKFDPMLQIDFKEDYGGLGFNGLVCNDTSDIFEQEFNTFVQKYKQIDNEQLEKDKERYRNRILFNNAIDGTTNEYEAPDDIQFRSDYEAFNINVASFHSQISQIDLTKHRYGQK